MQRVPLIFRPTFNFLFTFATLQGRFRKRKTSPMSPYLGTSHQAPAAAGQRAHASPVPLHPPDSQAAKSSAHQSLKLWQTLCCSSIKDATAFPGLVETAGTAELALPFRKAESPPARPPARGQMAFGSSGEACREQVSCSLSFLLLLVGTK